MDSEAGVADLAVKDARDRAERFNAEVSARETRAAYLEERALRLACERRARKLSDLLDRALHLVSHSRTEESYPGGDPRAMAAWREEQYGKLIKARDRLETVQSSRARDAAGAIFGRTRQQKDAYTSASDRKRTKSR